MTELLNTIRAEIKRRLADYSEDTQFEKGERYGYKQILSFLDTLQEPEVDELEKEIATWIPKHIKCEGEPDTRKAIIEWAGFVARHFAEWGAKNAKQ